MGLLEVIEEARKLLEEEDSVREELLRLSREVGRCARKCILEVHGGDLEEAREALETAGKLVERVAQFRDTHPRLYYSGSVTSALAEYVEARLLLSYVAGEELVGFKDLGIEVQPYLLGLADFVGELRRLMVRYVATYRFDEARRALELMEEVYRRVVTIAVPEALVPGFRRKVDIMRGVVESSSKELLYYMRSSELSEAIRELLSLLKERE